jgi:hypothetical protein
LTNSRANPLRRWRGEPVSPTSDVRRIGANQMNRLGWLAAALFLLLSATQVSTLPAGVLVNGDFSQGATGWTVVGDVDFTGDQAKLLESTTTTVLSQEFTISQGTSWLEIELRALTTEPVGVFNFMPDFLTFSLLNPSSLDSLVDVVPSTSTNFYIRDLVDTFVAGESARGVTISGASLPFTIRLDLSSLTATQSVDALLQFELVGGGDFNDASYTIDNILLSSSPSVVPEPGSMAIWGGFVMAGFSARFPRRQRTVA